MLRLSIYISFSLSILILQGFAQPDRQKKELSDELVQLLLPGPGASPAAEKLYAVRGKIPAGIPVKRRLSFSDFIVGIHTAEQKKLVETHAILLGAVNNTWKLAPGIQLSSAQPATDKLGEWMLVVSDWNAFEKKYAASREIRLIRRYPSTGSIFVRAAATYILDNLLPDSLVSFIAAAGIVKTERALTGFDLSANRINWIHRNLPLINGNGFAVSIKENRLDTADIDFRGRYLFSPGASPLMQTHATTMATIAAGAGNSYYTGKGVAWGATVASSDFANLLPDAIQELNQLQIAVQNHSYGTGIENYYGADAAAYDAQLYQKPELLHVFSAGNAGNQSAGSGIYKDLTGFANLTGSFKMSKNSIAVGATDSFANVIPVSSRGPAYDGRLKPELVAYGEDGSSGAAAIVSGLSLLLKQAWQQQKGTLIPAAAIKAVLLNSADDTGPEGIDFQSGYGAVNGWRALQAVQEQRLRIDSVQDQQTVSFPLVVPPNVKRMAVTLSWTDPPAAANSYHALVNDLDLSVTNHTQTWLPWVLNSAPSKDSLQSLPLRKKDSLNTNEQVTLVNPAAGAYNILVKGFAVNTGTKQAFAISWQYDTANQFLFTYPAKTDNLFPGRLHQIRWQGNLVGSASLEYRINGGNWLLITGNALPGDGHYGWQVPADSIGLIQFRLRQLNREWLSDTASISPDLFIHTGFNCTDSFLVYWQRAAVNKYQLYRLGNRYLEPAGITTDTAWIQAVANNPYRYFAIAPVLPYQFEGTRSYTLDYTMQQLACYISSFIADPSGTNQAKLTLQLGTIYRVSKVIFEKLTSTGFHNIYSQSPVNSDFISALTPAAKGLNTYRARIELNNGQVYYSNTGQVSRFDGQAFFVFPNPLQQGQPLHLLTEDTDEQVFCLYDLYGRKQVEQKLTGFLTDIRLPLLPKGVYYYQIQKNGTTMLSHKLILL